MKTLGIWCLAVVCAAACVTSASAEDKPKPNFEKIFKKLDANSDGTLSLEEFKAKKQGKALENAEKVFKKKDANSDSKLSLEEFSAVAKKKK